MANTSGIIAQIWKAIKQLNPDKPIREANRPFTLALVGTDEDIAAMRAFVMGNAESQADVAPAREVIKEYTLPLDEISAADLLRADLALSTERDWSSNQKIADLFFQFDPSNPESTSEKLCGDGRITELKLSIGRQLPGLRAEIAHSVVRDVSLENAVFVIASALGDIIPSPLLPLLGILEAASDTVVLTVNQIRMAFIIGAVYGAEVGYVAQWKEISSIIGAAFGWRAIARELVSKIPFGGGLVPKGAIAYVGTTAMGRGLIFFYTTGRHMTKKELLQSSRDAYARAAEIVRAKICRRHRKLPPGDEQNIDW